MKQTSNNGIFLETTGATTKFFTKYNKECRFWHARFSKLAAALHQGLKQTHLKTGDTVLYLGASTGTTASHVADIVGAKGSVFAIEISPTVTRELVFLAEERQNIAPILADANQPSTYADKLTPIDWLYQDIAQKNQVEIFLKNLQFLKKNSIAFLVIKARSIDVTKEPHEVFKHVATQLKKEVNILENIDLEPYQKGHCLFVCKKTT